MRFRINKPHVINEIIDGEVVILNLDTGNYYSMDKAGADIWGLIEGDA
ncbi:MAG TPA: PqqD family protein, partial [Nitrospirae bacterium]|nr:PqqD family protein [Nitrospirota bacterium]